MPEPTIAAREVSFEALRPTDYISAPGSNMADFIPSDTNGMHIAVERSLGYRSIDAFMAVELEPDAAPWTEEALDLVEGFADKLGFLRDVEVYIAPDSPVKLTEERLKWLVPNAVAVYQEMLELTASVEGWSEDERDQAIAMLWAEMTMPDKSRVWRWWNDQAINYTDRKIKRLNELLRQELL